MTKNYTRTFKNGIELVRDCDENGETRFTAVDPNGYIGRTRIAESWNYYHVLSEIREYIENNKKEEKEDVVYSCVLVNEQGCQFDYNSFTSKKSAHEWASGRGTIVKYHATLYLNNEEIETWRPRG